jgi:hypothetical protein
MPGSTVVCHRLTMNREAHWVPGESLKTHNKLNEMEIKGEVLKKFIVNNTSEPPRLRTGAMLILFLYYIIHTYH